MFFLVPIIISTTPPTKYRWFITMISFILVLFLIHPEVMDFTPLWFINTHGHLKLWKVPVLSILERIIVTNSKNRALRPNRLSLCGCALKCILELSNPSPLSISPAHIFWDETQSQWLFIIISASKQWFTCKSRFCAPQLLQPISSQVSPRASLSNASLWKPILDSKCGGPWAAS